jgi:hypothetical protein
MRAKNPLPALLICLVLTASAILPGGAAPGTPQSLEFGFGGWLDVEGLHVTPAINIASGIGMKWLAIDFDWEKTWMDPAVPPDLSSLTQAVSAGQNANLNVLISITNPPSWAMTSTGPNPELTASLVMGLKQLYPAALKAVELYPEANTRGGWGTRPDPAAYAHLLKTVSNLLENNQIELILVAGGLLPLTDKASVEDIPDLVYLDALYKTGIQSRLAVISIRLPEITSDPLSQPENSNPHILRHYEEVRQVMLANQHPQGILWITRFSWPEGGAGAAERNAEQQADWLYKSYNLLRGQLYIGTAIFSHLNPTAGSDRDLSTSLVRPDGSLHPSTEILSSMVILSGSVKSVIFEGNISKRTPEKLGLKPSSP